MFCFHGQHAQNPKVAIEKTMPQGQCWQDCSSGRGPNQNPNASGISLVEEPELGLHPRLLDSFVDQLREYARDQQIILTTHSPLLLDSLSPEEVWITTRDDQGFSALACMAAYPELNRWRDNFNTGEIWMNVAEAQLATSE